MVVIVRNGDQENTEQNFSKEKNFQGGKINVSSYFWLIYRHLSICVSDFD